MPGKRSTIVRAALVTALLAGSTAAQVVSIKLTTDALGLGSSKYNDGSVVDADVAGKIVTSPVTGQGTILTVQKSGIAGPGTAADPLLATITARTHLDTVSGLPVAHDFQAGAIFLTDENTSLPDGTDEGLGVRAFTVSDTTGLRTLDGSGRARIEGSKDVSGGTGPANFRIGGSNNGAPHVDEEALFTFNPALSVLAASTEAVLSKFDTTDVIDLSVTLASGATLSMSFQGTGNAALLQAISVSQKVWRVRLAGVPGVGPSDLVRSFSIRAIEDNPSSPSGTAEHFLITGVTATVVPCPLLLLADTGAPGAPPATYNLTTTSPQFFAPGEALRWSIAEAPTCACAGGPLLLIANVGFEAVNNAVTSGIPGFNRFHSLSAPSGLGIVLADGFGLTPYVGFQLGYPGPNFVGSGVNGFITPPGLPPCFAIKAQAVVLCPGATSFAFTNEIVWISTCP